MAKAKKPKPFSVEAFLSTLDGERSVSEYRLRKAAAQCLPSLRASFGISGEHLQHIFVSWLNQSSVTR